MDSEMKKVVSITLWALLAFVLFLGFIALTGEESDPYCDDSNQFVSDEQWEQLCDK